ncbi:hypothetical protein CHARACLAT_027512 [Characodon lateralis]|uniref:Uncharacterized protein n=1 Tax=Characodon lateralis TaxID=208331 RepID=A0ABU7CVT3_9TELE|nr:hypothetical protein [Characodon lateralis]
MGMPLNLFRGFLEELLSKQIAYRKDRELPMVQLLHMQTQLSESGPIPRALFLYLALRKVQKISAQQAPPCQRSYLRLHKPVHLRHATSCTCSTTHAGGIVKFR